MPQPTVSTSSSAKKAGGAGSMAGSGPQQSAGGRQDSVSMGNTGQSYELIKSTQVGL